MTPPAQVNSGYFRSTLLLVLGLLVVALLFGWSSFGAVSVGLAIAAAAASYLGFAAWQFEWTTIGRWWLWGLGGLLTGLLFLMATERGSGPLLLNLADVSVSAAVLGASMAAMLLGHYYLTAPWMSLAPLRRMVIAIALACVARAVISGVALATVYATGGGTMGPAEWFFYVVLRWLLGVAGPLILAYLTWKTIDLGHTQAATGLLYVIVILTLLGEATGIALRRIAGGAV